MKNLIIITSGFLLFAGTQICGCGSCSTANAQTSTINQSVSQPRTVTLKITGMTCGGCANSIHNSLLAKNGIIENEVKYPGNMATIKYDPEKITEKEIIATIEKVGYKVVLTNEGEKSESKGNKCEPGCTKSCCTKVKSN